MILILKLLRNHFVIWEDIDLHYTLLIGVHGVGKTTLLNNLKEDIKLTAFSISDLIRQAGNNIKSNDKFTRNVMNNQELWKQEDTVNNYV